LRDDSGSVGFGEDRTARLAERIAVDEARETFSDVDLRCKAQQCQRSIGVRVVVVDRYVVRRR
jgi:hypothetical protein